MTKYSEKELLEMHLDCLFTYEGERMVTVNEPWGCSAPAPLLITGRTVTGEVSYRFGQRATSEFIRETQRLLAGGIWDFAQYQKHLGIQIGSQEICFAASSLSPLEKKHHCRILTVKDESLLQQSFREGKEEIVTAQPYVGCFCDGKIVAICRSVRKGKAHEAGIETMKDYQRRGFGLAALDCWTSAVMQQGHVALYSAAQQNAASQAMAQKGGYVPYAEAFSIG